MTKLDRYDVAAWLLAAVALFAVLRLGLLAALLAGLLVYELVHMLASGHARMGVTRRTGKAVAVAVLSALIVTGLTFGVIGLISSMTTNNLVALLRKMADVAETARLHLPTGVADYLPSTVDEWEAMVSRQLRGHAAELRGAGEHVARILVYILIGLIIGALTAFHDPALAEHRRPLARALGDRASMFRLSFRKVVFAQLRISLLNTSLTAAYLYVVLPSFGVNLPLKQTMVAVTFVAGLLPVIGNLISNTVIVMVSLSVSAYVAAASLLYLVCIHKLEYFVNARIIGGRINARAWEILIAMLVMDAWFGIAGAIAAPVFYAYVKEELQARRVI